jgi:hypothetical protein
MSDATVESTITDDMAAWMAGSPNGAWQFNQATTGDDVTDLTGGGGDQSAISGTTVVSDPAGWTYYTPGGGGGNSRPLISVTRQAKQRASRW